MTKRFHKCDETCKINHKKTVKKTPKPKVDKNFVETDFGNVPIFHFIEELSHRLHRLKVSVVVVLVIFFLIFLRFCYIKTYLFCTVYLTHLPISLRLRIRLQQCLLHLLLSFQLTFSTLQRL